MRTKLEQISKSGISGSTLKLIACISMLIDHSAVILGASGIADLLLRQVIGRLAFPIFAFLLVEGFLHTRNPGKYFCNLFFFALISELPYDLVITSTDSYRPEFTCQNTLFTLSLGLLTLICARKLTTLCELRAKKTEDLFSHRSSDISVLSAVQIGVIALFGLMAHLLHLDYGFFGIACIGAMYLYRRNRPRQFLQDASA